MIALRYPFQEIYPITQAYSREHPAVDWGAPMHSAVLAAAEGRVQAIRFQPDGYGLYCTLEHPGKSVTLYAHLDETLTTVGELVSEGQVIAYSGCSGNSTGPHLHFEYRPNGKKGVDPLPYIKAVTVGSVASSVYVQPVAERFSPGDRVILKDEFNYVNLRPIPAFGADVADIGDYTGGAAVEVLEQKGDMIAVKVWLHGGYVRCVQGG